MDEYLTASVSGSARAATLAELRAKAISSSTEDLRQYLNGSDPGDEARARRVCSVLKEIGRADENATRRDMIGALASFNSISFPDQAILHILLPILRLRSDLGDSSSHSEMRSIAFGPDTPTSIRLEIFEGLKSPDDAQVLRRLKEILSNPGEDIQDRVFAARQLAEAGDDREALQFGLRLVRSEFDLSTPECPDSGSSDGYAILCRISENDPGALQLVLNDLTSVGDYCGSRAILFAFDASMSPGDWRRTEISTAVRRYTDKVLAGELEDSEILSTALSVLRKAGTIPETEVEALARKIDERYGLSPSDDVSLVER